MRIYRAKEKLSQRATLSSCRKMSTYYESYVFPCLTDSDFYRKRGDAIEYFEHKISDTNTKTIWSNQPFRRNVSKALYLRTLFMDKLSKICKMGDGINSYD